MFEQSLYNQEAFKEVKSQEGELFHDYEIKNWDITPRLYKILAISAIANIAVILIAGQTSLLTAKGCDSPLVSRVCQVLDTVYVGSLLFGTDREYVDQAYEKTELADADITYVDVSSISPPLYYPSDYLKYSDPDAYARQQQQANNPDASFLANGIPNSDSNITQNLLGHQPKMPKFNPHAVVGPDLISPLGSDTDDASIAAMKKGHTGRLPQNSNSQAEIPKAIDQATNTNSSTNPANTAATDASKDEAKADQFGVYINKRPLKDRAKDTLEKLDKKTVKLDESFKVVVAGTLGLGKDGKTIILKNPKPVPFPQIAPSDPAMVKLVQDWIIAVGDAGWFGYLDKLKSKNIIITVEQNDTDFVASVHADQPSENDAKMAASGLNTLLGIAVPAAKGDEQTFLKQATTTADGKAFILNFSIPKPLVQEMIQRKLAESKEPKAGPSSTALITSGGTNSSK